MHIHTHRGVIGIYLHDYAIMEGKTHDLLLIACIARLVLGTSHSESEVPKTTDIDVRQINMFQLKKKANLPFLCLIILFRHSGDLMVPTYIGKNHLLYLSTESNVISSKNTLIDTPRNTALSDIWTSLCLLD
jgi:hypothetical protein